MTWLVLTVVLSIAAIGGIVYAFGAPLGHKAPALGFAGLAGAICSS
jgi:hypothetical protein